MPKKDSCELNDIKLQITNLCNSDLYSIKEFVEHEIYLSERTIEDGMEERE